LSSNNSYSKENIISLTSSVGVLVLLHSSKSSQYYRVSIHLLEKWHHFVSPKTLLTVVKFAFFKFRTKMVLNKMNIPTIFQLWLL